MADAETLLVETRTHGRALLRRTGAPAAGVLVGFHGYAEHAGHQLERLSDIPGANEWMLLSVQGLHRFYRGRSEDVVASWMTREDRLVTIADNVEYVQAALDAAGPPAGGVLVFAGFSQGVAMAFRAAVNGRRAAHGVIAVGGDVPPELLQDRTAPFPAVLLVRGETDAWYTPDRFQSDTASLTARGVQIYAETVPGGHEWTPRVSARAGWFLAQLLAGR